MKSQTFIRNQYTLYISLYLSFRLLKRLDRKYCLKVETLYCKLCYRKNYHPWSKVKTSRPTSESSWSVIWLSFTWTTCAIYFCLLESPSVNLRLKSRQARLSFRTALKLKSSVSLSVKKSSTMVFPVERQEPLKWMMLPVDLIWSSLSSLIQLTSTLASAMSASSHSLILLVQRNLPRLALTSKAKRKLMLSMSHLPRWVTLSRLFQRALSSFPTETTFWPSWWKTRSVARPRHTCSSIAHHLCTTKVRCAIRWTMLQESRRSRTQWRKTRRPRRHWNSKSASQISRPRWIRWRSCSWLVIKRSHGENLRLGLSTNTRQRASIIEIHQIVVKDKTISTQEKL